MQTQDSSLVYFIQSENGGPIKIGTVRSPQALTKRVCELQVGSAHRLKVLKTVPGGRDTERNLHIEFARWRMSGEWFLPAPELVAVIGKTCCAREEPRALRNAIQRSYDRGYADGVAAGFDDGHEAGIDAVRRILAPALDYFADEDDFREHDREHTLEVAS